MRERSALELLLRKKIKLEGQPEGKQFTQPVFVTGLMRSGTSFLVQKICQHPQYINIGTELNEVWSTIGGADCLKTNEYKDHTHMQLEYAYNMTKYISDFIQESKTIKRHAMRFKNKIVSKSGRICYDWMNVVPVNKSPQLCNKTLYLNSIYPKSKFIVIIRDIYGQSASMKSFFNTRYQWKNQFINSMPITNSSGWNILTEEEYNQNKNAHPHVYPNQFDIIPKMWLRLVRLLLTDLERIDADKYIILRYQDLFLKQKQTLKEVFRFLNPLEKYNHEVEKICNEKLGIINTPTKGNPINKWEKHLSISEIKTIENITLTQEYKDTINKLNQITTLLNINVKH